MIPMTRTGAPSVAPLMSIVSQAKSTPDGIKLFYRRYTTSGSVILAWNSLQNTVLLKTSKGNYFFVLRQPSGADKIEPVNQHDAQVFFERHEREITSAEAFPAIEKGAK